MEKEQLSQVHILVDEWKRMTNLLLKGNQFDCELFKKTFQATFALLAPVSCSMQVDKQLMQMVVNAYRFATTKLPGMGKEYTAATVITERMLQQCVTKPVAYVEQVEGVMIYVVEAQEDVYLDFRRVDVAVDTLANVLPD